MKDPIRWCEEGSTDELERQVLLSEAGVEPPAGASAAVWGKLAGELGLSSVLVTVAAAEGLRSAARVGGHGVGAQAIAVKALVPVASGSLTFIKGVVVGMLACTALWGGSQLLGVSGRTEAGAARQPAAVVDGRTVPIVAPLLSPARSAAVLQGTPTAAVTTSGQGKSPERASVSGVPASEAARSPSAAKFAEDGIGEPSSAGARQHQSELREEALLLREARAFLRSGELSSAEHSLEESRRRFAAPELFQEREALLIELLFRQGHTVAAGERARTFLKTFPESPHAARLQVFTKPSALTQPEQVSPNR